MEIDSNLIPILGETLNDYPNVTIINDDILKVDINHLVDEHNGGNPIKVVANLPYYITTPHHHGPVRERRAHRQHHRDGAEGGGRPHAGGPRLQGLRGAFLAVQYYASPYIVANVPPNCFIPRPMWAPR